MKKTKVYEVKLEKGLGYTYIKLIAFDKSNGEIYYAIEPLNFYSLNKVVNIDSLNFNDILPLTCYLLLSGPIREKGKYAWKYVAEVPVNDYEDFLPDIRGTRGSFIYNNREKEEWYILNDFDWNTMRILSYDEIRHITWSMSVSQKDIITRLTMTWLVRLGIDIKSHYSFDDASIKSDSNLWLLKYKTEAECTIFYADIDKQLWNKSNVSQDYED